MAARYGFNEFIINTTCGPVEVYKDAHQPLGYCRALYSGGFCEDLESSLSDPFAMIEYIESMAETGYANYHLYLISVSLSPDTFDELARHFNPPPIKISGLSEHQPDPTPNQNPAVWDLVQNDMKERDQVGQERYGTRLQPFNGRDALIDSYQEALDLVVYLRQLIFERDGK